MAQVTFTNSEGELLARLLDQSVSDLRAEIAHTDSPFFKDQLREQKKSLQQLEDRIKHALAEEKAV